MHRINRTSCVSCLAALLAAASAKAQVDPANEAGDSEALPVAEMGQIVVTGSRSGTPLEDLAISVTVVDEQQLTEQLRFDTNIGRALEFTVPGVSIQPDSRSSCQATIRGRSTSFQINGIPVNDDLRRGSCNGAFLLSPFAIERIEAVRGGSALYGAGAPGGIVNLLTRTPHGSALEVDATAQTSFNPSDSGDSFITDVYAGLGQAFDRVDYYLGVGYRDSGFPRTPDGDYVPSREFDALSLNGTLGLDFGTAGDLKFTGTFYREELGDEVALDGNQVAGENFGAVIPIASHPDGDDAFDQLLTLAATYTHDRLLGHEATVSVFYQDTEIQQRANFFDANFGGDFFFATNTDNERMGFRSTLVRSYAFDHSVLKTSYGLDYTDNRFYRPIIDTAAGDAVVGFIAPETILETTALFGQLEVDLGRLRLSGGVRQEWYEGEVGDQDYDPSIPRAGTPGDFRDANLALFNAGAIYALRPNLDLFAGFSQGAEISQLGRATRGLDDPSTLSPEPAASDQYEIGFRRFTGRLRFEAAAFYSDSEDAALLQVDPSCAGEQICTLVPLRAPQEIYGLEGMLDWTINGELELQTILTWQRGEIFDEDGNNGVALASDQIVPLRLSARASWWPSATLNLGLQATYYGEGDFFSDAELAEGFFNTESQFLMNADLGHALGPGELYLAVSNLFNDKYVNVAQQASGDFSYFVSEGRRVTLGYKARF